MNRATTVAVAIGVVLLGISSLTLGVVVHLDFDLKSMPSGGYGRIKMAFEKFLMSQDQLESLTLNIDVSETDLTAMEFDPLVTWIEKDPSTLKHLMVKIKSKSFTKFEIS